MRHRCCPPNTPGPPKDPRSGGTPVQRPPRPSRAPPPAAPPPPGPRPALPCPAQRFCRGHPGTAAAPPGGSGCGRGRWEAARGSARPSSPGRRLRPSTVGAQVGRRPRASPRRPHAWLRPRCLPQEGATSPGRWVRTAPRSPRAPGARPVSLPASPGDTAAAAGGRGRARAGRVSMEPGCA